MAELLKYSSRGSQVRVHYVPAKVKADGKL